MQLDLNQAEKAVVIAVEGTAVFHVKSLVDGTCYKAVPRGKLKRKKRAYYLSVHDIVLIRPLEDKKNFLILAKLVEKSDKNYTEAEHDCSFKSFLEQS